MMRAALVFLFLLPCAQGLVKTESHLRAAMKKEVEEDHQKHHLNRIYETPEEALPWHIIFGVSGLISPVIVMVVVINKLYFKMTRIGREQEDLKMLLRSYGFEQHHPLVIDLLHFYYY